MGIRKAARDLLTLEDKDPRRLFEGNALLRRLVRVGGVEKQNEAGLRFGPQSRGFLGKTSANPSLQAWIGQVHSSCARSYSPKTHSCPQTGGECTFLCGSFGQPKAH